MKLLTVKCPSCTGVTEVDQSKVQNFCQYCGTIFKIEWSSVEGSTVEKKINSEGEVKLAAVKQVETQYFNGEKQFDEVLAAYSEAEIAGGRHADYWIARARFFAKGNLKEFREGRVSEDRRKEVVDQYVFWMDRAIAQYSGNATPLKMEKEKTIGDITNAFEGRRKKAEARAKANQEARRQAEARTKANLAAQRQAEARAQANRDARRQVIVADENEFDDAGFRGTAAQKKTRKIILIAVIIITLLLLVILLRACRRDDDADYNIAYYEAFLELSYTLDLLSDDATRSDILDLNIDFGEQDVDTPTLRVFAPTTAELNSLTFHFDEDDILTQISIGNANYFNGFAASAGLTEDIADAFATEELELTENALSFAVDEFAVRLRLHSDQFNIDISHAGDELTAEQRALWDLIEARIDEGYDSWSELITWADENDISFSAREGGAPPIEAIYLLIDEYGLVGDYLYATPGLDSLDDPDEVLLFLHFENLTYNDMIAELSSLNRNSGRELNSWLDNGGRTRLESHFETVEILNFDDDGEPITELPEVVEFVQWEIDFVDRLLPAGEGRIRIEQIYRILEVEDDEEEEEEDDEDDDEEEDEPTTLTSGTWVVGEDLPQGRYLITGDSAGTIVIWRGPVPAFEESLGEGGIGSITTYVSNGDIIEISGITNVSFTPVEERALSNTLTTGNWIVGIDIPAGQFYATASAGTGTLIIWRNDAVIVNEILGDGDYGVERISVDLADGDVIAVTGLSSVVFE